MPPDLFTAVQPRGDVLTGALSDAIFAASLDEVVLDRAPEAYGNPERFFAATHPSAGLRSVLNEALGRISGYRPDAPSIIRLETNLGGGKTHNLIALYHAARGHLARSAADEFMDVGALPVHPVEQLATFVGTGVGATNFPETYGVTPKTLWGYLALQLGADAAYQLVRADDEALTAAGANDFKTILGEHPSLILLDELGRYLATAQGVTVGKSTLDQQTTAFLMALMEAVDASPRSVLVITTTEVSDAFGGATQAVLDSIAEARSLMSRREHVLRPSDEADLPHILSRRLFASIDVKAKDAVAKAYADAASEAFTRGADIPERMTGPAWSADVEAAYPFHPNLIQILDKRLSTIPNFQRTRGALRLLARAVRLLWESKPSETLLIHPHHIDLADKDIAEDLSSRLDRAAWEPIIRADIASQPGGQPSHAEIVDQRMGTPYARRLAITTYLFSLTRDVPGVPASTLFGSVLTPGDDQNIVTKAMDNLESVAWFLHTDARGFRFSSEASLPRLIQEAEQRIAVGKVKTEATGLLARLFRDSALKVKRTWEDAKIPDKADDAWLVILHWDEFGGDHGVLDLAGPVPTKVQDLWEKTPTGGLREFRNRLVFLLPTSANHEGMLRTVRRHLALKALSESPEMLQNLGEEKRKELKEAAGRSEMESRIAVCNHVNILFVPQGSGVEAIELDVVTQASLKPNQTDAVLERLAAMDKTLSAGDKPLDPGFVKSKLGALLDGAVTTSTLIQAFARRGDLKLVLDRAQLVALITAGVRNGVWEYQDPERGTDGWGTKDHPNVPIRIAEDTWLHPAGSAPTPTIPLCPLCGQTHTGLCPGGGFNPAPAGGGGGGTAEPHANNRFATSGAAGVAVQSAREQAVDAAQQTLKSLEMTIDPVGAATNVQLARLQSVVPQGEAGVTVSYSIDARVALDPDHPEYTVVVQFHGPAAEYQSLKSAVDHLLRTHQATLQAAAIVQYEPPIPLSGDTVEALRRRASETGPDKCTLTISTGQVE